MQFNNGKFMVTTDDRAKSPDLGTFVKTTVEKWLVSDELADMRRNNLYYLGENPRVREIFKSIQLDTGAQVALLTTRQNLYSDYFGRITRQHVGHLLKNDLVFDPAEVREAFGAQFNHAVREIVQDAYIRGVSWGMWDGARLRHIPAESFVPIYDGDGELVAGIVFKRQREADPWRYFYYEGAAVTEFRQAVDANGSPQSGGRLVVVGERRAIRAEGYAFADGFRATREFSPNGFPIRMLHTNKEGRSELTKPIRTQINAYDLLKTGRIDELLKARLWYLIVSGYSASFEELQKVRELALSLGIVNTDDDTKAEFMTMDAPVGAYEQIMKELERGIMRDAQAVDTEKLGARASTSDEAIQLAQSEEDLKIGIIWSELEDFIAGIAEIAGIAYGSVMYSAFKLSTGQMTDQQRSQVLQGYIDRGLPLVEALRRDALFEGEDLAELERVLAAQSVAMDEAAMREFEAAQGVIADDEGR